MKEKNKNLHGKDLALKTLIPFWTIIFLIWVQLMVAMPAGGAIVKLNTSPEQIFTVTFPVDVLGDSINNIYGAAYDVIYDPDYLEIVDADASAPGVQPEVVEGNLLNNGGSDTTFIRAALENQTPGTLVVGISRSGMVNGIDASPDSLLLSVNFIPKKTGTTTVTFNHYGLQDPDNSAILVDSWDGLSLNIIPLTAGDINASKSVNLADAILVCQIVSHMETASAVYKAGDINGDGQLGVEEIIYILQNVAGLR